MINNKKVIITVAIFVAIIICLAGIFYFVLKKNQENISTTLTSTDGKFSIKLPNTINYRINSVSNNDFTIDLYAEKDDMFMYATTIEKARELDLYDVTSDDKTAYFKDKENLRDDSRNL